MTLQDFGPGTKVRLHGFESVFTRAQLRRLRWRRRLEIAFCWFAILSVLALYAYAVTQVVEVHRG